MKDWNEQAAPNNNLAPKTLKTGEFVGKEPDHEFSSTLAKTYAERWDQAPGRGISCRWE